MVGYYRIHLAMGGMNLGISAFSILLVCLLMSNSLPMFLPQDVTPMFISGIVLIGIVNLIAGLLNITKKRG
jgi:hypothetical protein